MDYSGGFYFNIAVNWKNVIKRKDFLFANNAALSINYHTEQFLGSTIKVLSTV